MHLCVCVRGWDTRGGGGVMSKHDETHLEMNASPFISSFSGIHSQTLMGRADKDNEKRADMNGPTIRGRERRNEEEKE